MKGGEGVVKVPCSVWRDVGDMGFGEPGFDQWSVDLGWVGQFRHWGVLVTGWCRFRAVVHTIRALR